jgi:hypothetical protein
MGSGIEQLEEVCLKPCTLLNPLHPTPYYTPFTLHPTLHPIPYTLLYPLHPTPYSTPYTLEPQPPTLNPRSPEPGGGGAGGEVPDAVQGRAFLQGR